MQDIQHMPIRSTLRDRFESMVEFRRDLHQHPELGFKEVRTAAKVIKTLRGAGLSPRTEIAETGLTTVIDGGSGHDRTILVRADMDALPLTEETAKPYASTNHGAMHACGHDGHTSILTHTVLETLASNANLKVGAKFLFQPAEEGPGGALPMIEQGVLESPEVEAAFGLHLWNNLPVGTVAVTTGPFMASADEFEIVIHGRGGHGAYPHDTVDSVVVGSYLVTALQTLVSRNVDPTQTAVVSIGTFDAGSNFNIIAERARLRGTLRTFDPKIREMLIRRLEEVGSRVAETFGARCEFTFRDYYPTVRNDAAMADFVADVAAEVVGPENVRRDVVSMGGEDMAFFLQKVPGCFFFLGSQNSAKGLDRAHHSPYFDFDEDAMPIGAEILMRIHERYPDRFPERP